MSLKTLKDIFIRESIDYFIQPNVDEFFSEYLPESEKRLEFITGFTGSNATVIFGKKKSYFFTDGRYIIQAQQQIDIDEYEILNLTDFSVLEWIKKHVKKQQVIAIDGRFFNANFVQKLEKIIKNNDSKLKIIQLNPIDEIWVDRPKSNNSDVYFCDKKNTGLNSTEKRKLILENLKADSLLISNPENLCWLLNIRASDIEYNPLLLANGILTKDGLCYIFLDESRIKDKTNQNLEKVQIYSTQDFVKILLSQKSIQLDLLSTNYSLLKNLLDSNKDIIYEKDPINLVKSIKNNHEIEGSIKAHEVDGLAVTKFLFWFEKAIENNIEIDELLISKKILEFRKESKDFIFPSFATISSFAENGAIIHYQPNNKTNKKIKDNSLFLIDSGGQYNGLEVFGTTDITRTISVGKPSDEMILDFTRVLKGHIALARAKFPKGTTGAQLDVLARYHLWQDYKNYDHGTGHGVGSFLSVHEGPCGISKNYHQELIAGMILSNEPGFYLAGRYGIRIENLILVKESKNNFLEFSTISLAPIDCRLIDFKMLTYPEKKWLKNYHKRIFQKFEEKMTNEEKFWFLENFINIF